MAKASQQETVKPRSRPSTKARTPARERGIERYRQLLDATDALLTNFHADEVGLYQIADKAGFPPASVYHFFPTKEAAFLALARRYLKGFVAVFEAPVEAEALSGWLTLMERDRRRAAEFYNAHPPAMKLLLGRYGGRQTREADMKFNIAGGFGLLARLDAAFAMPNVRNAADKFRIALEIQDAIWAVSYAEHARITDAYLEESARACRAYLRVYYPDWIDLREEQGQMVAQGIALSLPVTWTQ